MFTSEPDVAVTAACCVVRTASPTVTFGSSAPDAISLANTVSVVTVTVADGVGELLNDVSGDAPVAVPTGAWPAAPHAPRVMPAVKATTQKGQTPR